MLVDVFPVAPDETNLTPDLVEACSKRHDDAGETHRLLSEQGFLVNVHTVGGSTQLLFWRNEPCVTKLLAVSRTLGSTPLVTLVTLPKPS